MKSLKACLLCVLCGVLSCFCTISIYKQHTERPTQTISPLVLLPETAVKLLALEFKGITSDYLMLNTMTFMGEKLLNKQEVSTEEWLIIYRALKQIINLDPRACDPYILAETTLPWDAGMVEETNEILKNAARMRPHDYRPYFFLWYNYFYFLKDQKTAGHYLQKAAKIPGAPKYYAPLATRMHLYSGEIQGAILFTKEILTETNDPAVKNYLQRRLEALQKIAFLEEKMKEYRKTYGNTPKNLEELISTGIISAIPDDPYGGQFYLLENGRVYTTSNLILSKKIAQ